jgi:peptidoglycan/xylan/chitin deacetylase (PgdA/CDA1 family)
VIVVSALALPVAAIWGALPASAAAGQAVPGTQQLSSVACSDASACQVVGSLPSTSWPNQGAVLAVSNGVPGSAQPVPDTGALFGVTCPAAATCEAVGFNSSGGVVVPITNGTTGTVQPVPGTQRLAGVACSNATTCEAVGQNFGPEQPDQGVVVPITNGTAGGAQVVPGTPDLVAVACPSPTTCVAVGTNSLNSSNPGQGVVVPIVNGTPDSAQVVPGSASLSGITCLSATTCLAVGTNSSSGPGQGLVVPITNGTPGSAQIVPGTTNLSGAACQTPTTCEAVGQNAPPGVSTGVRVPIINGAPGGAQIVPGTALLNGVACPSSTFCEAAGSNTTGGVVASIAVHTAVSLTFDNAALSQYTLGYQQALAPHRVKATFYINTGVMGGANHLSWSQVSALAAAGDEIGGKTVDGTNLTTLTAQQQISEICNDRQAMLQHRLTPTTFAYPGGAFNAIIETEVQNCGYGTARTAGGLSPAGPTYAENVPPKDWLALRAYAPTGQVTLANLEALVTGAASHGGAWVPIVIQKVCAQTLDPTNYATCTAASGWVDLADLNTFLSWVQNAGLAGGAPAGTVFSPIRDTAASTGTTIDFATASQGTFNQSLFTTAGITFTQGNYVGFVQGHNALIGPAAGQISGGFKSLSVQVAPAYQGTATYTLTAFQQGAQIGATSVTVTQDTGDPTTGPAGYVTISIGRLPANADSFWLSNVFVRSSFPSVTKIDFGVSTITFSP